MTNQIQRLIVAVVVGITLQSHAVGQVPFDGGVTVPPVPPEIQVPAGNKAYLKGSATGTQNYVCLPAESGFAWKFQGPQAALFYTSQFFGTQIIQQITTHFLSANPFEGGLGRPTWQSSLDTSSVWGKARASSTNPAYVAPGAIPWLLVEVVGAQKGPMGGYALSETTFIHRLNTSGGVIPTTGCTESGNVGAIAFVPYTTDYYFYKATNK